MGTRLLILLSHSLPLQPWGPQESCRLGSFHSKSGSVTPVCPGRTSGESLGCDHKAQNAVTLSLSAHLQLFTLGSAAGLRTSFPLLC